MGSTTGRTVFLSCGEPSGDVYLAEVARALKARRPDLRLVGIAGPRGRDAGVEAWATMEELSVMGFSEVVRHLPRLLRLGGRLAARAQREGVAIFLPVDYPGFHVRLAAKLRGRGIRSLHFIPPKTWSWGRWRLRSLRRSIDRCAVIFPFEVDHYGAAGVDARFVGHPLVDLHAKILSEAEGEREGLLVAPGSRRQELARLAPVLADALQRLREAGFEGPVRVSRASSVRPEWLAPFDALRPRVEWVEGPLMPELRRARVALVCSGTATVEAALAQTPHCIVYRAGTVSYALARRLATVEHIGMANIVLGRRAFPEFLQGDLRAEAVASAASELFLEESAARKAQLEACAELRSALGEPGAFGRVADLALETLDDLATPSTRV